MDEVAVYLFLLPLMFALTVRAICAFRIRHITNGLHNIMLVLFLSRIGYLRVNDALDIISHQRENTWLFEFLRGNECFFILCGLLCFTTLLNFAYYEAFRPMKVKALRAIRQRLQEETK